MGLDVGTIVTGKVTGIKKFGAFVTLENGKSGLVHISEISNTYVSDVGDYLQNGQEVKVKIIGIDASGRINLSMKQAEETPVKTGREAVRGDFPQRSRPRVLAEDSFEDKLKKFLQESNSKLAGVEVYSDRRGSSRRKSRGQQI